jgi:hypothetical protein
MTRYRKRNNFQNTFKDYLVPIVWWALLLLVIFSIFNKDSSPTNTSDTVTGENKIPISISFVWVDTKAFISYPSWTKEEITDSQNLYKGETIIVKDGSLNLSLTSGTSITLNKIAEFKYNEDGGFSLYSSDAWMSLSENTNITMKYASVTAPSWSTISLTQNEAGSTIYVLSWSAKVSNLWWISTSLIMGQKLSVSRQLATSTDIDLSSEKWNIDSYFKGSDWFIDNKWFEVLSTEDVSDEIEGSVVWESWLFLSFDSLRDEMSTSKSSLSVSGKVLSDSVASISINNTQATINRANQTFSLSNVQVWRSVNDLVIKIYGNNKSILEKKVITVYSSGTSSLGSSSSNTSNTTPIASSGGVTFWVDATDFTFTSPSVTGKFVATGSEITIRWATSAKDISKVEVNGFELASFNGSTWRYHAFTRFETLEEWTNQYKVDYFWADGNLVYTTYYTIVKKPASAVSAVEITEIETISDETSPE